MDNLYYSCGGFGVLPCGEGGGGGVPGNEANGVVASPPLPSYLSASTSLTSLASISDIIPLSDLIIDDDSLIWILTGRC